MRGLYLKGLFMSDLYPVNGAIVYTCACSGHIQLSGCSTHQSQARMESWQAIPGVQRLVLCMQSARVLASEGSKTLARLQSCAACMYLCVQVALSVLVTGDVSVVSRPSIVLVALCTAWACWVCTAYGVSPLQCARIVFSSIFEGLGVGCLGDHLILEDYERMYIVAKNIKRINILFNAYKEASNEVCPNCFVFLLQ